MTVRSRLYEKAAPLLRFQSRMVDNSPGARSNRAQVNAFFRNQLAELFAEEIEDSRSPLLDSLDALLSWEAWDRLRSVQGLSARQARQVVVCWLGSSLGV